MFPTSYQPRAVLRQNALQQPVTLSVKKNTPLATKTLVAVPEVRVQLPNPMIDKFMTKPKEKVVAIRSSQPQQASQVMTARHMAQNRTVVDVVKSNRPEMAIRKAPSAKSPMQDAMKTVENVPSVKPVSTAKSEIIAKNIQASRLVDIPKNLRPQKVQTPVSNKMEFKVVKVYPEVDYVYDYDD